jgi:hypothetical protein
MATSFASGVSERCGQLMNVLTVENDRPRTGGVETAEQMFLVTWEGQAEKGVNFTQSHHGPGLCVRQSRAPLTALVI